jgi:hypothetical protein
MSSLFAVPMRLQTSPHVEVDGELRVRAALNRISRELHPVVVPIEFG